MNEANRRVAVIGGARTPFVKAGTVFRQYSPLDLSVHSVNGLLGKQKLDPGSVGELVYGITVVDARIPHFAREVVFASKLPPAALRLFVDSAGTARLAFLDGSGRTTAVYP